MLRKWATPLTAGSFLLVALTGILMFFKIRPGLTTAVHEWLGMLFVVASVLHLVINWRPMMAHLRRPLGQGLVAVFTVLTVFSLLVPGGNKGPGEGMRTLRAVLPSLSHARVDQIAPVAGIGTDEALKRLAAAGMVGASGSSHLDELARTAGTTPEKALIAVFPQPDAERATK